MFKQVNNTSLLNRITLCFLLVLVIIFSFRQIYSLDIGFHLKTGLWILQNLEFPAKDMFSYAVGTHNYIDLQWLYQVSNAVITTYFGELGLVAGNAILIAGCFILALFRITRKQNLDNIVHWQWMFLLAILSTEFLFETRPHVFSWLYLNLVFLVLDEYVERGRKSILFLPFIMLLWTNTHSLFIIGWIVIGSYILGSIWKEKKLWTQITKYGLLSIGISLINPYFFSGIAYPFRQFQLLQSSNFFKNNINELISSLDMKGYFVNGELILIQPLFWFHIFLFLSVVIFIRRLKRIQLHEILIFLFFLYLGCTAVKNIGFFVFAILPATIQGIQPIDSSEKKLVGTWWKVRRVQAIINCIVIALSIILTAAVITNAYYINFRSNIRFGYKCNNTILPCKAAQYLRNNHLEGKILNHFNFGGFLMYKLPQKVSIDGRLEVMGEKYFYKYMTLWNIIDKSQILMEFHPEIVIFPYHDEFLWIHYFKKDTAWQLLYFDEIAVIYAKKGYADSIAPYTYSAQLNQYNEINDAKIDSILRLDYSHTLPILSMTKPYFPSKEIGLSTFCYYNDRFDDAIQIGLHGLLKSTEAWPEMFYNMGHYFFELKEYERSAYCYQRFLITNTDTLANQRVELVRSGRIQK
jgi:hypothetical protein